ncbi:RNA methyltransferase [Sandarakinorhabdus sp. AAP62]|uniref:RNA methyltransferase n=1 Tax=Sandarakinorhabdus sp. AAP62 TaxID=1248916 RepID=UPI0002F21F9C|nr:RNA methyltransferase [Sandarakinorhabdus sp. AAP62]
MTTLPPNPPAIILVRPQLGMNIGAVARAMLNFGLTELRLVQPRDGWPNPEAGPSAAGADSVIEGARLFDSLADAIADCTFTIGTAQTTRDMVRRVTSPAGATAEMQALPGKTALLFGPERTGLVRDDLLHCHAICTIPSNPDFGSLNLAQAVAVLGYAWVTAMQSPPPSWMVNHDGPAAQHELAGLIAAVETQLANNGFFNPAPGKTETALSMLRNVLTRPGFTGAEVQFLRGVVRSLAEPRNTGSRQLVQPPRPS